MANKYVHLSSEQRKEIERLIDLGKSLGSAIRRVATGKMCKI